MSEKIVIDLNDPIWEAPSCRQSYRKVDDSGNECFCATGKLAKYLNKWSYITIDIQKAKDVLGWEEFYEVISINDRLNNPTEVSHRLALKRMFELLAKNPNVDLIPKNKVVDVAGIKVYVDDSLPKNTAVIFDANQQLTEIKVDAEDNKDLIESFKKEMSKPFSMAVVDKVGMIWNNKSMKKEELTVGQFLKRERERLGLSISQLSARSGVGKSTISETENGVHTPTLNTVAKLVTALNN